MTTNTDRLYIHNVPEGHRPGRTQQGAPLLQPHEVQRGMAFPDDYVMLGTKRDRVRLAGNAVTPPVAKMLMRRILPTLS